MQEAARTQQAEYKAEAEAAKMEAVTAAVNRAAAMHDKVLKVEVAESARDAAAKVEGVWVEKLDVVRASALSSEAAAVERAVAVAQTKAERAPYPVRAQFALDPTEQLTGPQR